MAVKLAVQGGTPVIPKGFIKDWPPVSELDRKMVLASLDGACHTYGPNCTALEQEFAGWMGVKHALFANSGTAALHMCLVACGCGVGDEVIVPAYTWPSSATCCLHHNIIPVFVDIDWATMNIDLDKIEAAVTPRTRAIIAVHLHGLALDMGRLMAIARRHNLIVIEDFCQAHGAAFNGRRVGTFGLVGASSTNQNKCLSSGEGGFFVSNDKEAFERGKTLWYFGESRPPDGSKEFHTYGMGWMYRCTDLTAAFARAQLTRLDEYLAQQQVNAARLTAGLKGVPNLILPTATPAGCTHNWYNYTIRFDMEALGHARDAASFRDKLVKALNAEGVQTGVWQGWPVPKMTVFQARNAYGKGCPWSCPHAGPVSYALEQFPVAQRHCDWHTGMTTPLRSPNGPEVADRVTEAFHKVLTHLDQVERL
ncbi:MAG: L-glutamine:2-deoxy-scyllo-inosose aminotransferase [Lentisphaerae bacterium ADurb.BinA184]|nr:MAG: L-glutamine:2-deoxy-scyllo-inosose aminotransferase [Lentisphaerae bacterium ADurb.BinA184]